MLFNSLEFLFLFLPPALVGYYLIARSRFRNQIFVYLVLISLVFYSVWNPPYTLLLLASVAFNYVCGLGIEKSVRKPRKTAILAIGIAGNIFALFYYKYANFFVDNVNLVTGTNWNVERVILPLAISFYSLQQIAYLVDISRGEVKSGGIARYVTFVIFFPQLIAGPIVHYREMMPQFFGRNVTRFAGASLIIGLTIFLLGLFKKTVIADSAALYATPIFDAAREGRAIGLVDGWTAGITYTIQLYFDFSGYSDMAVGLARMFGIKLPLNFHSPLKATSIIDYWRRWHMTLQQFISAYMYQPLVLPLTRLAIGWGLGKWPSFALTVAAPTILVFMIVGLWHGAAWTFVVFGAMHGVYLTVNELWRQLFRKRRKKAGGVGPGMTAAYRVLTLVCVVLANVVFRAPDLASTFQIWRGMFALDQIAAFASLWPATSAELLREPTVFVILSVLIIALLPNTQQVMGRYGPVLDWKTWRSVAPPLVPLTWRPTLLWALGVSVIGFLAIAFISRGQSEFIYFNF